MLKALNVIILRKWLFLSGTDLRICCSDYQTVMSMLMCRLAYSNMSSGTGDEW